MYQGIISDPENIVDQFSEGMEKVRTEKYAIMSDSTYLKMEARDDCSLKLIKEKFYTTGFAFVVPEDWQYKQDFNEVWVLYQYIK